MTLKKAEGRYAFAGKDTLTQWHKLNFLTSYSAIPFQRALGHAGSFSKHRTRSITCGCAECGIVAVVESGKRALGPFSRG